MVEKDAGETLWIPLPSPYLHCLSLSAPGGRDGADWQDTVFQTLKEDGFWDPDIASDPYPAVMITAKGMPGACAQLLLPLCVLGHH